MAVGDMINKLRTGANLSQEQFAELFSVSRQAVQKWESNLSVPEQEKLIRISKYFDISLVAVETGFDTDCNGATVGSVLGMANGIDSIDEVWKKPISDTLHTSIFGVGTVKISDRVKQTLEHIQ